MQYTSNIHIVSLTQKMQISEFTLRHMVIKTFTMQDLALCEYRNGIT